jgi:hypothetical protein
MIIFKFEKIGQLPSSCPEWKLPELGNLVILFKRKIKKMGVFIIRSFYKKVEEQLFCSTAIL